MLEICLISIAFLIAHSCLLYLGRTIPLFILAHSALFVAFVPALHLLQYVSQQERSSYHIDIYLLAHTVVLVYVAGFIILASVIRSFLLSNNMLIGSVCRVSYEYLTSFFVAWVSFKVSLVMKYGPLALSGLKSEIEGSDQYRLELYDTIISSYLTYFAVGASVIYVLKVVSERTSPKWLHNLAFIVFASTYLVLGEASMGARRFVLLLVFVAISAAINSLSLDRANMLIKATKITLAGIIIAVTFSMYFQVVRFNILDPEIGILISSGEPSEMAQGAIQALIPQIDLEIETDQHPILRAGPFELLYDVLSTHFQSGLTTKGNITKSSFEMIVPYFIAGPTKPSVNVDEILVRELGIIPADFASPDLPSSVLSGFLADYGIVGALIRAHSFPCCFDSRLFAVSLVGEQFYFNDTSIHCII